MSEPIQLNARMESLIDALTGAFASTLETAAERLQLAGEVARIAQRMSAFGAVLEIVDAQRQGVLAKMDTAPPALRAMYEHQLTVFAAQEAAILERVGVPQPVAKLAIAEAKPYYRDGRRFVADGAGDEGALTEAPPTTNGKQRTAKAK